MEGAGLFNPDPLFFPYLSRASLGPCDWRHLWTLLLLHVQEGRQESLAIFPHACLGRYVWLELNLSLGKLELLVKQLPSLSTRGVVFYG